MVCNALLVKIVDDRIYCRCFTMFPLLPSYLSMLMPNSNTAAGCPLCFIIYKVILFCSFEGCILISQNAAIRKVLPFTQQISLSQIGRQTEFQPFLMAAIRKQSLYLVVIQLFINFAAVRVFLHIFILYVWRYKGTKIIRNILMFIVINN